LREESGAIERSKGNRLFNQIWIISTLIRNIPPRFCHLNSESEMKREKSNGKKASQH